MFEKDPFISVVVNTYNRAKYLENTLIGLQGLDWDKLEVVVVNGPSNDGTSQILDRWSDSIKIASCPEINLSMSRNIGINVAQGEIIAFIDDDAVPHPKWLKAIASHYCSKKVAAVGGYTIDNSGRTFQARKTICDRFGNAYSVPDYFNERPLNQEKSPYYPSLLGTNSTFRKQALVEIGGFDHVFAYFLDETDVCLRLVDAGYSVIYEPNALIFHQYAPSHLRNGRKIPRSLRPSSRSKAYFILKHGVKLGEEKAGKAIADYKKEILNANAWLADHAEITPEHRASLDQGFLKGIDEGSKSARLKFDQERGDLFTIVRPTENSFKEFPLQRKPRVALVSRGYPPHVDAGIARWTSMVANGLAKKGYHVHVLTEALHQKEEATTFEHGVWMHRLKVDTPERVVKVAASHLKLPENIAAWTSKVRSEVQFLKSFDLKVVSFPIWDLEGMSLVGDKDLGVVLSLHTSYAMAKPFKQEWNLRPIYEHFMVNKMIAAEKVAIEKAPVILANSKAIVEDLTNAYGIDFHSKVTLAPHGTPDILDAGTIYDGRPRQKTKVLYVGRHEKRKGFDIAIKAALTVLEKAEMQNAVEFLFVGGETDAAFRNYLREHDAEFLLNHGQVEFRGVVDRSELDSAYLEADIVIMPSRYESFGLVAIEAMSAGKPVIALAAGGLKEIINDNHDGFLVADDDIAGEHMAEKIASLCQNPNRLQIMSQNARRTFEQYFTIDAMVDKITLAYDKAIYIVENAQ
ncbi:glycosyltransferase [Roseomonas mucosa]|uniref:glycosyltransferase n=1 Tax=Roseomonas mucosa TaxID=207340 RepID=UPI0028CCDB15|nr:glycosyltransferase [Roseomonas mucosa]MDT8315772.1 glycosyltransferase [Roseomonas mucosa]MDT8362167.1 glycosyltransferase [Roseomonas mucosa]